MVPFHVAFRLVFRYPEGEMSGRDTLHLSTISFLHKWSPTPQPESTTACRHFTSSTQFSTVFLGANMPKWFKESKTCLESLFGMCYYITKVAVGSIRFCRRGHQVSPMYGQLKSKNRAKPYARRRL